MIEELLADHVKAKVRGAQNVSEMIVTAQSSMNLPHGLHLYAHLRHVVKSYFFREPFFPFLPGMLAHGTFNLIALVAAVTVVHS